MPSIENSLTQVKINGIPYAKNTINYQGDENISIYYLGDRDARIIQDNKAVGHYSDWKKAGVPYSSAAALKADMDEFFFSIASSPQQSFKLGSLFVAFEDFDKVRRLTCNLDGTANGAFTPFLLASGATYSVPVDTALIVASLLWATNARLSLRLGYADDIAGTNFVEQLSEEFMSPENNYSRSEDVLYIIPANKFPIVNNTAAITAGFVILQALEEPANSEVAQQIPELNQIKLIDNLQATNSLLQHVYSTVNALPAITLIESTFTKVLDANADRVSYKIGNTSATLLFVLEADPDSDQTPRGFPVFARTVYESKPKTFPVGEVYILAESGTPEGIFLVEANRQ